MSTRIRYVKTSEQGIVESMRVFRNDSDEFKVQLDTSNKKFLIRNLTTGKEVQGGRTTNLTILKRQVKVELIKMGVVFAEENRAEKRMKA